MRFNKPCNKCGTLSRNTLCDTCRLEANKQREHHRKPHKQFMYGRNYRKQRAHVIATAVACHICGEGYKPADPWEADHLYPELGDASPLLPAHRSCNQQRGNKPIN